jgi:hypothetical protein
VSVSCGTGVLVRVGAGGTGVWVCCGRGVLVRVGLGVLRGVCVETTSVEVGLEVLVEIFRVEVGASP